MYKNTATQSGFTLIELLIAMTILGILMTLAIPVYFDHQAKGQLSEAVTLGGAHRVNIEDYFLNNGVFPPDSETQNLVPWSEEVDGEIINRYPSIGTVKLVPESSRPKAGSIDIQIADSNKVSSQIRGGLVQFRRTESGSWYCLSDIDADFLPKGCRTTQ